jgi:hypothetical protein
LEKIASAERRVLPGAADTGHMAEEGQGGYATGEGTDDLHSLFLLVEKKAFEGIDPSIAS